MAHESWGRVVESYRALVEGKFQSLSPNLRLLERLAATPQAERLRVGMSMTTLLISATPDDLSSVPEPFIAVSVARDDKHLKIEYESGRGDPITVSRLCEESEAEDVLRPLFLRLWNETSKRI
jgi:hypothetical protein